MRSLRHVLALFVIVFALGAPAAASAQATTEKKLILPAGQTNQNPALAPGILVGNTLYMSGQLPPRNVRDSSMTVQTKAVINLFKNVLQAAGMDLTDVVSVQVYLTDLADFEAMNAGYHEMFTTAPKPTRTTVAVAGLVGGAKIEITMTAVKSK